MGYRLCRVGVRLLVTFMLTGSLCGCLENSGLIEGLVMGPDLEPGYYWVEYRPPELVLYEMPRCRGDDGQWHSHAAPQPPWYSGPALYRLDADGRWECTSEAAEQTLDDWLQVWDVGPAAAADTPSAGP